MKFSLKLLKNNYNNIISIKSLQLVTIMFQINDYKKASLLLNYNTLCIMKQVKKLIKVIMKFNQA